MVQVGLYRVIYRRQLFGIGLLMHPEKISVDASNPDSQNKEGL